MPKFVTSRPDDAKQEKHCFISYSPKKAGKDVLAALEAAANDAGFQPYLLDRFLSPGAPVDEVLLGLIARSDCIIADISETKSNVLFEIGSARAMGKAVFFVCEEDSLKLQPSFLSGYLILSYSKTAEGLKALRMRLAKSLTGYQRQPQMFPPVMPRRGQTPFFVDWDKLERSDAENLCRELLAQLGFQRPDWFKESREIDLIAELPKKDPDGFEYRELWCVSMGRNAPIEMLLEMAHDSDYLIHRMLRFGGDSRRINEMLRYPLTFLLIVLDDMPTQSILTGFDERSFSSKRKDIGRGSAVRVRVWDRNYLTSLVHQFPNLGYKYFSDEGRAASKFRKTPEELYRENVELAERLSLTVRQLEEEKNLRVRAERDAVWKDISFSAAHKLGNPIFAIETSLDPLERRISDQRVAEALNVMLVIRASIEKAKAIVDQFKSLSRAQEMTLIPVCLRPLIEASCQVLVDQNVVVKIVCDENILIIADQERLAECFDELISNSLHWFDKPEKTIEITVNTRIMILPPGLDPTLRYVLIHFRDNGSGVPVELKSRIFDAFFTTQDHGTGLGLALVRRMIEGQKGVVFEVGLPGKGADFEIYLPLADTSNKCAAEIESDGNH